MNPDDTEPEPVDKRDEFIEQTIQEARRLLLERLEGNFQIVWTGYDEDENVTRFNHVGYGNIHARIAAVERWVEAAKRSLFGDDVDIEFIAWDDEQGEPE